VTAADRRRHARIARIERWLVTAYAQERLIQQPKKWTAYLDKHPGAGVISAALLDDLFQLARER
jgi:hypothetical protein